MIVSSKNTPSACLNALPMHCLLIAYEVGNNKAMLRQFEEVTGNNGFSLLAAEATKLQNKEI